jgi:anaerobic selenocysteine-containing dehydrogenase
LSADAIDHRFIDANVDGVSALRTALQAFIPSVVAERAGVDESDLRKAAAILAAAERAYVAGGTGVSMSGRGNLCFYLLLCLQSVRGYWPRAGAQYAGSPVLIAPLTPKAQPRAPHSPILEGDLRIRGLRNTVAGMPTNALPDEILTPGDGQVRALITNGNPLSSWPDTDRARRAMANLELLVIPNVELSETTRMAHYVIAAKKMLEAPGVTQLFEFARHMLHPGYGWDEPYAQHTPAVVAPPAGADVIEEWQFLFRLAQRMNLPLKLPDVRGGTIQPTSEPTSEELIDFMCAGSSVAIEEIRKHSPALFPKAQLTIGERDSGCSARLNVGDPSMMEELAEIALKPAGDANDLPYRLIVRRSDGTINSMHRRVRGVHRRSYNPAFMNPADMERLGLDPGALIVIRSRHSSVTAIVESDETLRSGVLSISHGYGAADDEEDDPQRFGTNVNRLLKMDQDYDRITGMPLMSAVPVAISRAQLAAAE